MGDHVHPTDTSRASQDEVTEISLSLNAEIDRATEREN
jgi:hypothetical protein